MSTCRNRERYETRSTRVAVLFLCRLCRSRQESLEREWTACFPQPVHRTICCQHHQSN